MPAISALARRIRWEAKCPAPAQPLAQAAQPGLHNQLLSQECSIVAGRRLLQFVAQQVLRQQQQRDAHQGQGGAALIVAAQFERARRLQMLRPAESHGVPPQIKEFWVAQRIAVPAVTTRNTDTGTGWVALATPIR